MDNTGSLAFTIQEAATFRDQSSPSDFLRLRWYHNMGKQEVIEPEQTLVLQVLLAVACNVRDEVQRCWLDEIWQTVDFLSSHIMNFKRLKCHFDFPAKFTILLLSHILSMWPATAVLSPITPFLPDKLKTILIKWYNETINLCYGGRTVM